MNILLLGAARQRMKGPSVGLLGRDLLSGDAVTGYYGTYTSGEVITGSELASLVGLTAGSVKNNTGNWLGFSHQNKKLLIAQTPRRYNVSWNHLNARGLMAGKVVNVQGRNFICRLITGSEWTNLLYRVSDERKGVWARFSEQQLGVGAVSGSGRASITAEAGQTSTVGVHRGETGISTIYNLLVKSASHENNGWRPVLELVE